MPRRTSLARALAYFLVAFWCIICLTLNEVYTSLVESQQKSSEKLRLFSERLRSRIARLGLQQNELAEKVGVEPGAVGNWVKGLNAARGEHLRRVAEVLGVEVGWLSGEQELRESEGGYGTAEEWRAKALESERRLTRLRTGLQKLLEESSPAVQESPRRKSEGPSSSAKDAAARLLAEAGELGDDSAQ